MARVTLEEVQALAAKWIERFHLRDWQIHFAIADCEHAAGTCRTDWIKQIAWITIDDGMPGVFFEGKWAGLAEDRKTEWVVMHELWHVKEAPLLERLRELTKDLPEVDAAMTTYRERMIDQALRTFTEADAAGAWI